VGTVVPVLERPPAICRKKGYLWKFVENERPCSSGSWRDFHPLSQMYPGLRLKMDSSTSCPGVIEMRIRKSSQQISGENHLKQKASKKHIVQNFRHSFRRRNKKKMVPVNFRSLKVFVGLN
jgi:hypothetical protein